MNNVRRLQSFFEENCNGDWEHFYTIRISTLDNPGWSVFISLTDTKVQDNAFDSIENYRSDEDWTFCKVEENTFKGYGGVANLEEILSIFLDWADE